MLRYRIYQIEPTTETEDRIFMDFSKISKPNPSEYVMVYDKAFTLPLDEDKNALDILNELFFVFNVEKPEDYYARSMSVSDVIEIYDDDVGQVGRFYYCNKIGFVEINFDSSKAETPIKKEYELLIVPESEAYLLYSNENLKKEYSSIGFLRGYFTKTGEQLWTTFTNHCHELKCFRLKIQFDSIFNYLKKIGVLRSYSDMSAYFHERPEYKLGSKHRENECGFKIETERFRYYFRIILRNGDYNLYCFIYTNK